MKYTFFTVAMLLLPQITSAHGTGFNGGSMMVPNGFTMFGGVISMALFWVLIIVGVVFFVKYLQNSSQMRDTQNRSLDILKDAWAIALLFL